jgi:hypothetical protein
MANRIGRMACDAHSATYSWPPGLSRTQGMGPKKNFRLWQSWNTIMGAPTVIYPPPPPDFMEEKSKRMNYIKY